MLKIYHLIQIVWIILLAIGVAGCNSTTKPNENDDNMFFSKQNIYYYLDSSNLQSNNDEVILNNQQLFKKHTIDSSTNIASNASQVLWLKFTLDTTLLCDYLIKFLPLYKRITFYSYDLDTVCSKQVSGLEIPYHQRKIKGNTLYLNLKSRTLNSYYIKYEFYNDFLVAAFEIQSMHKVINDNQNNAVKYTIFITLILLIFLIAIFNYALNLEVRNLFYGLYVLFYGIFAASSYYLWHMISDTVYISHTIHAYYVPFSLSTCFFALYIIYSIPIDSKHCIIKILYFTLIAKFITIVFAIFDLSNENWTNIYFTKIDVLIFAELTYITALHCFNKRVLVNYWLLIGVIIIFIAQTVHAYFSISFTSYFMSFDIIWFGIGMAIHQRISKNEKMEALKEVITLKSNLNSTLEEKVRMRTLQLNQRTEELDNNLKTIAELNEILSLNNISLQKNVKTLSIDRVLNKELSFEEFKAQFPDKESCFTLLSALKWKLGFICNNCKSTQCFQINKSGTYQKKCAKCGKIHSASADTLFHNIKFSLEKAFYITFLTSSNKKYSVEQISDIIELRKGTVWGFKKKVEDRMEEKKFAKNKGMTWQDLIL